MATAGTRPRAPRRAAVGELAGGAATLARGATLVLRRPRLFLLGALPPLVTSVLFVAVLVVLNTKLLGFAGWLTPFADSWSSSLRQLVRVTIGVALAIGAILIMVITFSTLTLALGSPLYDRISELVEQELGNPPPPREERLAAGLGRGLGQSVVLVSVSVLGSVLLFLVGLVPVLGLVSPVLSALFGGWMVCTELVGTGLERRGRVTLAERRAAMRGRRWRSLGFGVPVFLLLAIPFLSVLAFPAAAAGGTILARELLD